MITYWTKIDTEISGQSAVSSSQSSVGNQQSAKIRTLKPRGRRGVLTRWGASAAAVIILLIGFWFFYDPATAINAPMGEQLAHHLPDASNIQLNAGSSILYQPKKWEKERTVKLEGEAFFEVEKGSKFTVVTPSGTVEVLGTSFNVFARDGELEVVCFTGKVKVSKNNQEVILTKGLATSFDESQRLKSAQNVDLTSAAKWRSGEFIFNDESLRTVFGELERQFDVKVKASTEILNATGSYFFLKSDSLEDALQKITTPKQLKYKIQGRVIEISK